jgi:predicted  nucleic acid-binding Zn-ribbon protein
MNPTPIPDPDQTEIREGDILFDCPHCGKNMAIEAAGAGLMVPCAACGKEVQVPIPDAATPEVPVAAVPRPPLDNGESPEETIRQLDAALAMANEQIDRLIAEKESLQERRAYLEQIRMANTARYEQIAAELATLQDALDRALVLLAEARAEKPA